MALISSNKYFRSGYGEKLRELLGRNTTVEQIIDFGDAPVFDATNYPCIVILQDLPPNGNRPRVLTWQKENQIDDFVNIFNASSFTIPQEQLSRVVWSLESEQVVNLLKHVKSAGIPLSVYLDNRFFRGLVTGSNTAFVVDSKTRETLIAEDKGSAEILKTVS
jgi:hypothetical protein